MAAETESYYPKGEINQERILQIIHFGSAPAFFISFSQSSRREELGREELGREELGREELERLIEMYNNLFPDIPAWWRTFGINGYVTTHHNFELLKRVSEDYQVPVFFGLPLNNDSFAIKASAKKARPSELVFCNLGSPAIVAAYKVAAHPDRDHFPSCSIAKIGDGINGGTPDPKRIILEKQTEEALQLALNIIENTSSPDKFDYYNMLGLHPLFLEGRETLNSAFVLKIDVNDSTRRKIESGEWLEEEVNNSLFMSTVLNNLRDQQIYFIDVIGESMTIICENPRLISEIYQGLKNALRFFPKVTVKAVGTRLPEVTLYFSEEGTPVYYTPMIPEETWRVLELKYKKQVEDGSRQRQGTFYIPRQGVFDY